MEQLQRGLLEGAPQMVVNSSLVNTASIGLVRGELFLGMGPEPETKVLSGVREKEEARESRLRREKKSFVMTCCEGT